MKNKKNAVICTVQNSPEGGYEASSLDSPVFNQAETVDELKEMVRDTVRSHFEEDERPGMRLLHFVKDEVITV